MQATRHLLCCTPVTRLAQSVPSAGRCAWKCPGPRYRYYRLRCLLLPAECHRCSAGRKAASALFCVDLLSGYNTLHPAIHPRQTFMSSIITYPAKTPITPLSIHQGYLTSMPSVIKYPAKPPTPPSIRADICALLEKLALNHWP